MSDDNTVHIKLTNAENAYLSNITKNHYCRSSLLNLFSKTRSNPKNTNIAKNPLAVYLKK